jgi:hypothetical protein
MRERSGGVGVGVGFGILVHGRSVFLHYLSTCLLVLPYYAPHTLPLLPLLLERRLAWPVWPVWLAGWLSIFCQSSASPLFGSSSARPPSPSELRAAAFLTPLHQSLPTGPTAYRRTPPPPPPPGPHTFPNTRGRSDQIRARASCCVKSSPSAFGVSQSVVALTPLDQ